MAPEVLHMSKISLGYLAMIIPVLQLYSTICPIISTRLVAILLYGLLVMALSTVAVFLLIQRQFYAMCIGIGIGCICLPITNGFRRSIVVVGAGNCYGYFMSWYCVGMFKGPVVGGAIGQTVGLNSHSWCLWG